MAKEAIGNKELPQQLYHQGSPDLIGDFLPNITQYHLVFAPTVLMS